ncbi:MAG: sugar phosphate isomerase/epimerase [Fimbriimonadaceae bacterium]|nr:sugar phosphate isomerase/epimerase [Fimbriimonadaceae bacterium]
MFRCASWGAIGVKVGWLEGLDLAREVGFEGVDVPIGTAVEYVAKGEAGAFTALYADRGLRLGNWGLGVDWRGDQAKFADGLTALASQAAAGQAVGATRCATWVPSWSDDRPFEANFEFHVARFGAVARVLAESGCSLGLEFIGPATLRRGKAYEFVYDLPGMLRLCAACGPNVGLLLDAWHWYTSGGDEAQLAGLTADQVVVVHVNDAPTGIAVDQQLDNQRLLPAASGVIDIATFMRHLQRMGYDGPVIVEPFNQELREMEGRAAALRTKQSLDTILAMAGC